MTARQEMPARLALPLSAEGYAEANEAFRQCWTADRDEVLAFLQARLPAPAEPLRVLGVGVGDGAFDVRIIDALRAAYPAAPIEYVAVEPNEAQLQRFAERLAAHAPADVALSLHPQRAEDYAIAAPYDLIHYVHSLYHMPGAQARLIEEAVAGLRPGGRLLIALSAERGGIYQLMGRFWERIDYSFFTGGLFGQELLTALLDGMRVPYEAELYPEVAIDVSACFDPESQLGRHLLNFLLQADMGRAPAALRAEALAALDELARHEGGRRLLAHPSGVFVVGAPV